MVVLEVTLEKFRPLRQPLVKLDQWRWNQSIKVQLTALLHLLLEVEVQVQEQPREAHVEQHVEKRFCTNWLRSFLSNCL